MHGVSAFSAFQTLANVGDIGRKALKRSLHTVEVIYSPELRVGGLHNLDGFAIADEIDQTVSLSVEISLLAALVVFCHGTRAARRVHSGKAPGRPPIA